MMFINKNDILIMIRVQLQLQLQLQLELIRPIRMRCGPWAIEWFRRRFFLHCSQLELEFCPFPRTWELGILECQLRQLRFQLSRPWQWRCGGCWTIFWRLHRNEGQEFYNVRTMGRRIRPRLHSHCWERCPWRFFRQWSWLARRLILGFQLTSRIVRPHRL